VRVTCVVDDSVQMGSRFWGEHGVAVLIETGQRCVLFDTGQSGAVLLHNLSLLDFDPADVDPLALSHAHRDHTGGLSMLVEHLGPGTPLYANPDLFRERYAERDDKLEDVGLKLTRLDLVAHVSAILDGTKQEIAPGAGPRERSWTVPATWEGVSDIECVRPMNSSPTHISTTWVWYSWKMMD